MPHFQLNALSKEEEGIYSKFHQWYDRKFQPLCVWLARHHIKPDTISYLGLVAEGFFVYFFTFHPWIAFLFLILNYFFDMLDGSLARHLKIESFKGALLDKGCDHAAFLITFFTLMYFHLVDPFWGSIYSVNYVILVFFAFILNAHKISFPPIIRSKNVIYAVLLIWLLSGHNLFDPVTVFFSLYMVAVNLFLFHKLRCSLS